MLHKETTPQGKKNMSQTKLKPFSSMPKFYGKTPTPEFVLSAWPIFGGEGDETTTTTTTTQDDGTTTTTGNDTTTTTTGNDKTTTAGGSGSDDVISKLQSDPNALNQLLQQVQNLQNDLKTVTGKHDALQQEKDQQARSQMSKEQQLQTDLDNATVALEKMDRVIRRVALENAVLEHKDVQWHSIRQMMAELKDDEYDVDVDLDGGCATVTGIKDAVNRISKECPWLVANKANNPVGSSTQTRRTAGNPPRSPGNQDQQKAKRAGLISRFPAISSGQPIR